jgi:MFS family permease
MHFTQNPLKSLHFREFRLLWFGQFISKIGTDMQTVAVAWHLYQLTHSPLSLGLIGAARVLPLVLGSPFAGVVSDHFDRKKILLVTESTAATTTILLAVLTITHTVQPFMIYIILLINATCAAFHIPARHSMIPQLVPKEYVINAFSLNTLLWQTTGLLGPAVSGFVIALSGVTAVYIINAVSFLAIIGAILMLSSKFAQPSHQKTSYFQSLKDGFKYVRVRPLLYSIMFLDFFATFFASATTLLPVFATDILKVGSQGLGILYAAPSIGSVTMSLVLASMPVIRNQGKVLVGGVLMFGLATILFGATHVFLFSLIWLAFVGAGDSISSTIRATIRQINTPNEMRGRVTAINTMFVGGGPQLGEIEAGFVAQFWGARISTISGGIGCIIAAVIVAVLVPSLYKYDSHHTLDSK